MARANRWSMTPGCQQACDRSARLYCLEDASFNVNACRSDAATLCLGAQGAEPITDVEAFPCAP